MINLSRISPSSPAFSTPSPLDGKQDARIRNLSQDHFEQMRFRVISTPSPLQNVSFTPPSVIGEIALPADQQARLNDFLKDREYEYVGKLEDGVEIRFTFKLLDFLKR